MLHYMVQYNKEVYHLVQHLEKNKQTKKSIENHKKTETSETKNIDLCETMNLYWACCVDTMASHTLFTKSWSALVMLYLTFICTVHI